MKMSFENLYMSQSMHELFNKSIAPAPEEAIAIRLASRAASNTNFTLEAMIAAADSYSVSDADLGRYASHH
jgi:hypothetical protein